MNKTIVYSSQAPEAIGPYSQAVKCNNTLYCSGQIPVNAKTKAIVSDDFREQARQVFKNIGHVIEAAGCTFEDAISFRILLVDLSQFALVNEVMEEFVNKPYPARAAFEVSRLPLDVQIEVESIFALNEKS